MLNNYTVNIIYRNRAMEPVGERSCSLVDYCKQTKYGIMRTISDIESAFYQFQGDKNKQEWDQEAINAFQHIRHKLLDSANAIERLPQNLRVNGVSINAVNASEYFAKVINDHTEAK